MGRRPIIAGNWKLNHGPEQTREFFRGLEAAAPKTPPELLLFPPTISFTAAAEVAPGWVRLGVQNVFWKDEGAFTGENSAQMAKGAGASHALVGHSERRHLFGERDDDVSRKTEAVIKAGLVPVVCVGETLDERESGRVEAVILRQLSAILPVLAEWPDVEVVLAYEPVWAIGTGKTATPEDAAEAHATLRGRLLEELGDERGQALSILYGGSVKPDNAGALLASRDVDGVLVGGASLDPVDLLAIAAAGSVDTPPG